MLACRILLQHNLNLEQLTLADTLLLRFCKRCQRMFGSSDMHLHCHLKECILDYGPLHGFWCFPFERTKRICASGSTVCIQTAPELLFSAVTLTYITIGLAIAGNMHGKSIIIQLSKSLVSSPKLLDLNALLLAITRDPDLSGIPPSGRPQALLTLYVCTGCDYIIIFRRYRQM